MEQSERCRILVRGVGDVGSAVAYRLFQSHYSVLMHDVLQPVTTRRGMAFADAVFDGRTELDGVVAVRVDDVDALTSMLVRPDVIPVVIASMDLILQVVRPHILVDARMRKRAQPEVQRGLTPLTIGLGPNFVAGLTTDIAIETSWGPDLGKPIDNGATRPLEGEPRSIAGHARDRFIYAPVEGVFHTHHDIGAQVRAGETIAQVDETELVAPLDGVLRGITRDGVPVSVGTKVVEVDPRGLEAVVRGIAERPELIAAGVLRAVQTWSARGTRDI